MCVCVCVCVCVCDQLLLNVAHNIVIVSTTRIELAPIMISTDYYDN